MSDARWTEIDADVTEAVEHFRRSVQLRDAGGFGDAGLEGYRARMALMHAMQSGHTSLESALLRILDLAGEEAPSGRDWHADLIRRAGLAVGRRVAILDTALLSAANETRRFRHVAMRGYGAFHLAAAEPALRAASVLADGLPGALAAARAKIDP